MGFLVRKAQFLKLSPMFLRWLGITAMSMLLMINISIIITRQRLYNQTGNNSDNYHFLPAATIIDHHLFSSINNNSNKTELLVKKNNSNATTAGVIVAIKPPTFSHHIFGPNSFIADPSDYLCEPTGEWGLTVIDKLTVNKNYKEPPPFTGHQGVANSIRRGLSQQNIVKWNANPINETDYHEVLWLTECWKWHLSEVSNWFITKCRLPTCRTRFIICGPIGFIGFWYDGLQHLEFLVLASPWVSHTLRQQLKVNTKILVSGVDEKFWAPTKPKDPKKVVAYFKTSFGTLGQKDPIWNQTLTELLKLGYKVEEITYEFVNVYTHEQYRAKLDGASFALFFQGTETQGLSIMEAWSMDVPTFVYIFNIYPHSWAYLRWVWGNAAPWLNEETGFFWNSLPNLLEFIKKPDNTFSPRKYVLRTMCDRVTQYNTLRAIQCSWEKNYGKRSKLLLD